MLHSSKNPNIIRTHNLSAVLNLVWREKSISRTQIIQKTNLSASAITSLVNVLLESGFIMEEGVGKSRGGRRPVLLAFNSKIRYALGVDMGSSHITVILMDMIGKTVARAYKKFDVINDPEGSLDSIKDMIERTIKKSGINPEDILGLGLTVPVPLSGENNDQMMTYYMHPWETYQPLEEIKKRIRLDMPYYLENDANSGAIAEKYWGAGKKFRNIAFIKLGVGVGCGLVINDELFRGYRGSAGEIGHTTIVPDGYQCRCGNYGCMESYVGSMGILRDLHAANPHEYNPALTIDAVVEKALSGDEHCRRIIQRAGNYLGISIANLLNLVNPGIVILGGNLVTSGDLFMEAVKTAVRERTIPIQSQQSEIVISQLGEDVVAIGAATLVIHNAFLPQNLSNTLRIKR